MSPSVYQLRGYTPDEVLKQSLSESLTPESYAKFAKLLPEHITNYINDNSKNDPVITEMQQPCRDGLVVWIEVVAIFIPNESNELVEILGVSRHIQKRKEAELQLEQYTGELK